MPPWLPAGFVGNSMLTDPCDSVETVAQSRRIGGQQSTWPWFYDVIVAIATACGHLWLPAGFVGTVSMLSHVTQC